MEFIIALFIVTFIIIFLLVFLFDFNPNLPLLPLNFSIKLKYYKHKFLNKAQVPFWYEDLVYEKIKEMKDKHYNNIDIFNNTNNILRVYCNDKEIILIDRSHNIISTFIYNNFNEMLLLSYILYGGYNNSDTKNSGIDDFMKSVEIRKKLQSGDIDNIL